MYISFMEPLKQGTKRNLEIFPDWLPLSPTVFKGWKIEESCFPARTTDPVKPKIGWGKFWGTKPQNLNEQI